MFSTVSILFDFLRINLKYHSPMQGKVYIDQSWLQILKCVLKTLTTREARIYLSL